MLKNRIDIIPDTNYFYGEKSELDYKAICIYAATGFFLDNDTYFLNEKIIRPACDYSTENGILVEKPYFKWKYQPRDITLKQATEEFLELFENIIRDQTGDKKVILPLSGGLDSRTQAAALFAVDADVNSYSYAFENGHNETIYGQKIANILEFPFKKFIVNPGYLWPCIDELAKINGCYSEFTHPRQMAFIKEYSYLGDLFSLGHWGDVLFDDMGVPDDLPFELQVEVVLKKIIKKGGLELATDLWAFLDLEGNFEDYLYERIRYLLSNIDIRNSANARIRAFKSLYWAPRWTSVNLSIFKAVRPISLPYYDNRMCEFICTIPEELLRGRKIQIEYLKLRSPKIASVSWQEHKPFNLYNYHYDKTPWNLPFRTINKIYRKFSSSPKIQRNWELQFLGKENDEKLRHWLFENPRLFDLVPKDIVEKYYHQFTSEDAVYWSHAISMLLTLSIKLNNNS